MRRTASFAIVFLVGCGIAHGARGGKHPNPKTAWDAVMALPVDALIRVLPENQGGPDTCRVISVGDDALTCVREGRTSEVRLVFPRGAVRDVWVMRPAHDRHIVKWVFVGIGVGLGIALIVADPVIGGAIMAVVVAGIESPSNRYPMPMAPPRPPPFVGSLSIRHREHSASP
jgi:hypothetical protein